MTSPLGAAGSLRAIRLVVSAAACAALAGCGGGSSAPTPVRVAATPLPTPTPLPAPTALHGLTHEPLDAEIAPADPSYLQRVTFTAPGFPVREQLHRGDPTYLWPAPAGYLDEFAYLAFTDGSYRTVGWGAEFTVTLDGELAEVPAIVDKTREVLDEIEVWTGWRLTIGAGGACVIRINAHLLGEGFVGRVNRTFNGPRIVRADVEFATRQEITGAGRADYANTLLHEFGHVLGLRHSPNERDVMYPGGARGPGKKVAGFQEHEAAALHMMYQHRVPGTYRPDRAPDAVSAADSGIWRDTISD